MSRPHSKLHQLLWDSSYFAMVEHLQMRDNVRELDAYGKQRPASMPEEATTINLVRRLSTMGTKLGIPVKAVLHTRAVEGGLRDSTTGRYVRLPSGADLQLAVRTPAGWVNLLLQAKRLFPPASANGTDFYKSWDAIQNAHLVNWAAAHSQTPGMLLYNDLCAPFVTKAPPIPAIAGDWGGRAFGACTGANRVQLHPFSTVAAKWSVFDGTPAGIGICIDPYLLATTGPSAAAIAAHHFPLEHLAHPRVPGPSSGGPGTGGAGASSGSVSTSSNPPPIDGYDIPTQPHRPRWAARLLDAASESERDSISDEDDDFQVPVSVVIDVDE